MAPGGVGFLDMACGGNVLAVQWQEKWHFGVSSPEGHGYGEKPDEVCRTVEEAAARVTDLLDSGRKTEPPLEVTLRELRAEKRLPQTGLASLLGVSQPAVSRLEHHVSRMMVSSVRAVLQAMGGRLVIQSHFPDGVVRQIAIDDDVAIQPQPQRAAVSSRDRTKYDVTIDGVTERRLSKRQAIRRVVKHLCARGVRPEQIAQLLDWHSPKPFQVVDGTVGPKAFVRAVSEAQGKPFDGQRYFCSRQDHLIVVNGKTYAFCNQWGTQMKKAMNILMEAFPDKGVAYKASDPD